MTALRRGILATVGALIGFATLLAGSFSRFGLWRQVVGAIALIVVVKLIESATTAMVRADPAQWPLTYLPGRRRAEHRPGPAGLVGAATAGGGMILHRYFARRFLISFAAVFAVFFVMMGFFDLIEQARKFSAGAAGFGQIVGLALLSVPQAIYRILPLITVIATLALFLSLARTSELVVTRAAGRSALAGAGGAGRGGAADRRAGGGVLQPHRRRHLARVRDAGGRHPGRDAGTGAGR